MQVVSIRSEPAILPTIGARFTMRVAEFPLLAGFPGMPETPPPRGCQTPALRVPGWDQGCQTPTRRVPGWCWLTSMRLREPAPDEAATVSNYRSNTSHTMDVWSAPRQPRDGCLESLQSGNFSVMILVSFWHSLKASQSLVL